MGISSGNVTPKGIKKGHSHIARLILTNKRWPGNLHDA